MSGLSFHLTPEGRALLVNAANTGTNAILVTQIGLSASGAGVVGGVLSVEQVRIQALARALIAQRGAAKADPRANRRGGR